mgnify:CR=1 FL=1
MFKAYKKNPENFKDLNTYHDQTIIDQLGYNDETYDETYDETHDETYDVDQQFTDGINLANEKKEKCKRNIRRRTTIKPNTIL